MTIDTCLFIKRACSLAHTRDDEGGWGGIREFGRAERRRKISNPKFPKIGLFAQKFRDRPNVDSENQSMVTSTDVITKVQLDAFFTDDGRDRFKIERTLKRIVWYVNQYDKECQCTKIKIYYPYGHYYGSISDC